MKVRVLNESPLVLLVIDLAIAAMLITNRPTAMAAAGMHFDFGA